MAPYTYAESPLTLPGEPGPGPVPGALIPDANLGDGFPTQKMGPGFTLLTLGPAPEVSHPLLTTLSLPTLWGAPEGSAFLIRPDLHLAARWTSADAQVILSTLTAMLERP